MNVLGELFDRLRDLPALVQWAGYVGLFAIIFTETGLFFGFFLPGDSLLVTAGLLASIPRLDAPRGQRLSPIDGSISDNIPWDAGCAFCPRCPNALEVCEQQTPDVSVDVGARLLRCHNPVREARTPVEAP